MAPLWAGFNAWSCAQALLQNSLFGSLPLHFNLQHVCPITTLHICGDQNSMTKIPSCLFGSKPKWHFELEENLLTFFNVNFPLPNQNLWTVCQPTSAIATCVISILQMMPFTLEDWRRLPVAGRNIGTTDNGMQRLWEWILTYRIPTSPSASDSSLGLLHKSAQASIARDVTSKIAQSVARLWPLARRLRWPATPTLPR
jgi:hypothetical protein